MRVLRNTPTSTASVQGRVVYEAHVAERNRIAAGRTRRRHHRVHAGRGLDAIACVIAPVEVCDGDVLVEVEPEFEDLAIRTARNASERCGARRSGHRDVEPDDAEVAPRHVVVVAGGHRDVGLRAKVARDRRGGWSRANRARNGRGRDRAPVAGDVRGPYRAPRCELAPEQLRTNEVRGAEDASARDAPLHRTSVAKKKPGRG